MITGYRISTNEPIAGSRTYLTSATDWKAISSSGPALAAFVGEGGITALAIPLHHIVSIKAVYGEPLDD